MAKGSIRGRSDGQGFQGSQSKTSLPASVVKMRNGPTVTRSLKGDIKPPRAMGAKRIGAVANKYAMPIGPTGRMGVLGGRGIMGLNDTRIGPTANAPKATMNAVRSAPIKTQVKPNEMVKATQDVVRTVTNMKNSPTSKRGTNLGVSSGKTTGKTTTRGGTGGRTTGGGRSTGGGYSNAGPSGMGASGRGTGGKR